MTTPTKKKEYTIFELNQYRKLDALYNRYFSKNNCSDFLNILNKFAITDAILNSGGTTCQIEFKNSDDVSITTWDTCLIEVEKFNNLKTVKNLQDGPIFYITEYSDAILIYQLDFDKEHTVQFRDANKTKGSREIIRKPFYFLSIYDADFIIGKHGYERKTKEQLFEYVQKQRAKLQKKNDDVELKELLELGFNVRSN